MANKKNNKPKERIVCGRISLLQWKNSNGNGETFDSFSINKTVMQRNKKDKTKFSGQFLSLNGLTKTDLTNLKQAITEMEDKMLGVDGLEESD